MNEGVWFPNVFVFIWFRGEGVFFNVIVCFGLRLGGFGGAVYIRFMKF